MSNRLVALAVALPALLLAACPNEFGGGGGPGTNEPPVDPYWCCDADEVGCVCEGFWHCTEGQGGKHCIQQNPDMPDDGGAGTWDCRYENEMIVCQGDASDHPDAGNGGEWNCYTQAEIVICSREEDSDDYPDGEGEGPYDCVFENGGDARVCDQPGDNGDHPDDGWDCTTGADGVTRCRNENPDQPDDGDWDCYRVGESDVCVGDHYPDDEGENGWDCQENGELVTCEDNDGQTPGDDGDLGDGGDGSDWDCDWGENLLVCEGDDLGGEGEGEGEGDETCTCIEGARRYCDEPTFCNWGIQTCEENGREQRWGTCRETEILNGCQPGGADARDYEWHYGGGYWDGQVNDPNNDGVILMPPDNWYNPAAEDCALRKGFCVHDMWDLDNDGDNQESMGDNCADIQECV